MAHVFHLEPQRIVPTGLLTHNNLLLIVFPNVFPRKFMDSVQAQTTLDLGENRKPGDVRHYCPEHHIEWGYYPSNNTSDTKNGYLTQMENEDFCIYSGKTVAYHLEPSVYDVDQRGLQLQEQRRLSPCEEHEIAKCPPLEATCRELPLFNFNDDTTRGDYISTEFKAEKGISFAALGPKCYTPDDNMVHTNSGWGQMRIFDTKRAVSSYRLFRCGLARCCELLDLSCTLVGAFSKLDWISGRIGLVL